MRDSCYGFKSEPEDIEVKIGSTSKTRDLTIPAVVINDPLMDWNFALEPDAARMRADFIEQTATSNRCLRFADEIRKIANKVEEKM